MNVATIKDCRSPSIKGLSALSTLPMPPLGQHADTYDTRKRTDSVRQVALEAVQTHYGSWFKKVAQLPQLLTHYAAHLVGRNIPEGMFYHQNFLWCDPRTTSNDIMRTYYAERVAQSGTFAGTIELDALGHALAVGINLWSKRKDCYQRICHFGSEASASPKIHLLELGMCHFQAFLPPQKKSDGWVALDAGHGGDCLFLSAQAAMTHLGLPESTICIEELRLMTAAHILSSANYDERIWAASEFALWEFQSCGGWRKLLRGVT